MEPLLSVLCITYNQKDFIRQCLDGFVMQKTNFPFIVLINDDCSTDGTADIIREYEQKYPEIIKPVYNEKNSGSLNNFIENLSRAKTKYAAMCEGDDYWTDAYKLQKQIDFLEKNKDYAGCFHKVKVQWEDKPGKKEIYPPERFIKGRTKIAFKELLFRNYIQTNSAVYRWGFTAKNIKDYFPLEMEPGDWYLHLLHAKNGDFGFINETMGVYRKHSGGIWNEDGDMHTLKYGQQEIKFYYEVWKNLADKDEEYLNRMLLPKMKHIIDVYYRNSDFENVHITALKYPELVKKLPKDDPKNLQARYKKYKKLFTNTLIMLICALVIILILSFALFKGHII